MSYYGTENRDITGPLEGISCLFGMIGAFYIGVSMSIGFGYNFLVTVCRLQITDNV